MIAQPSFSWHRRLGCDRGSLHLQPAQLVFNRDSDEHDLLTRLKRAPLTIDKQNLPRQLAAIKPMTSTTR
jgi:hypothetical protein